LVADKDTVKAFWDETPCGTRAVPESPATREAFEAIERRRYELEPFIPQFARFHEWGGRRILEVGCGIGTDLLQFARAGARLHAVDLSPRSVELARRQLNLYGFEGDIQSSEAEHLPFADNQFDLVYSWGVIHHAPDPSRIVEEIYRVLRPGGRVCAMVYRKNSLVVLQAYVAYALLRLRPLRNLDDIIAHHVESPGTRAYTRRQVTEMFRDFRDVTIQPVLTPYDIGHARVSLIPTWVMNLLPNWLGWFMVVRGLKPQQTSA
jgi:ubiquinone/menaquinone biosynthesis C-methylase UbiE